MSTLWVPYGWFIDNRSLISRLYSIVSDSSAERERWNDKSQEMSDNESSNYPTSYFFFLHYITI